MSWNAVEGFQQPLILPTDLAVVLQNLSGPYLHFLWTGYL